MIPFLWIIAILFLINSISITFNGNFTLGTFIVYAITVFLIIYLFNYKAINLLCEHGFFRFLKIMFFIGLAFFIFMLCFVVISGYTNPVSYNEKAVIVLGAGLKGDKPNNALKCRLDAAYEYHLKNPKALIFVSGGRGENEIIPEGVAMKRYLVQRGIDEELIIEENASTSTEENYVYTLKLMENYGIQKTDEIVSVTNSFHCYRADKEAIRCGFTNMNMLPAKISLGAVPSCYSREVFAILYLWVFKN